MGQGPWPLRGCPWQTGGMEGRGRGSSAAERGRPGPSVEKRQFIECSQHTREQHTWNTTGECGWAGAAARAGGGVQSQSPGHSCSAQARVSSFNS